MTDMSHDEYLKLLQPFKQCPMFSPKTNKKSDFGGPIIPSSVDWRNQSDVGPVVVISIKIYIITFVIDINICVGYSP